MAFDINKLGPRPKSIYRKREFENFQKRLTEALILEGIDSEEFRLNNQYTEYAFNFYSKDVIDNIDALADEKIVRVPAIMNAQGTKSGLRRFPIVNEYRGHDLINAYYFAKTLNASGIEVRAVPVIQKAIIIT